MMDNTRQHNIGRQVLTVSMALGGKCYYLRFGVFPLMNAHHEAKNETKHITKHVINSYNPGIF